MSYFPGNSPPTLQSATPLGSRSILRSPSVSSQPFTKGHHHHHHQKLQTEPRRENMSSAFIRQTERGRSELQGASGYNRTVGVGVGVWMIDRDDPDVGRDRVIRSDGVIWGRKKRKERWWRARKEGGAEEGKQRRIPVQDKTILKSLSPSCRPSPSCGTFSEGALQDRASALQVGAMTHCYVNGNQMRATLTPWNHSKISLRLSLTY